MFLRTRLRISFATAELFFRRSHLLAHSALLAPIAKRDGIDNNQPGFSPTKQNYAQVLQKHCGSTFRAERFVKKMMLGATCVGAPLSSGGARGGGESPPSGSRRLLQPGIWVNAEL